MVKDECLQRRTLLHFKLLQFLLTVNQPFLATLFNSDKQACDELIFSTESMLVFLNKYWKLHRVGSWREIFAKIKVLIWGILWIYSQNWKDEYLYLTWKETYPHFHSLLRDKKSHSIFVSPLSPGARYDHIYMYDLRPFVKRVPGTPP